MSSRRWCWRCALCGERLFPPAHRPSAHRACVRWQPVIEAWERTVQLAELATQSPAIQGAAYRTGDDVRIAGHYCEHAGVGRTCQECRDTVVDVLCAMRDAGFPTPERSLPGAER